MSLHTVKFQPFELLDKKLFQISGRPTWNIKAWFIKYKVECTIILFFSVFEKVAL